MSAHQWDRNEKMVMAFDPREYVIVHHLSAKGDISAASESLSSTPSGI
jgi:hypothetical protein